MNTPPEMEALRGDTWIETTEPTAHAIVTMRLADLDGRGHVGVTRECALCDELVIVSPQTLAVFRGRPLPPIWCAPCALTAVRQGGNA